MSESRRKELDHTLGGVNAHVSVYLQISSQRHAIGRIARGPGIRADLVGLLRAVADEIEHPTDDTPEEDD